MEGAFILLGFILTMATTAMIAAWLAGAQVPQELWQFVIILWGASFPFIVAFVLVVILDSRRV